MVNWSGPGKEQDKLPRHAHFEELCVLATSGQLSAGESDSLKRHLVECDRCYSFLRDVHLLSDEVLPQILPVSSNELPVPAGMRERVLARACREGLKIEAWPPLASESSVQRDATGPPAAAGTARPLRPRRISVPSYSWRVWIAIATACAAFFALGTWVGASHDQAARSTSVLTRQHVSPGDSAVYAREAGGADRIRALTAERDRLAGELVRLAGQLESARERNRRTVTDLERQVAAAQSSARQDRLAQAQETVSLHARIADLQSELDLASQRQSLSETSLRSAREKADEYSARLELLEKQAPPPPSPGEVGSLIAARNLHIIDVYDSTPGGRRGRAFGRVFYVEGRSLVFYAYDLASAHQQKNITFHLWGEKVGSKEATLSLGVLQNEDAHERRWALTCNDPGLLSRINSVYVTVESAGRRYDTPHGSPILYAYFGAPPNHP